MLNINDLNQLLEHRHAAKLCYDEPWAGLSADGIFVGVYVTITASVHDCINWQRNNTRLLPRTDPPSDKQLLQDFITVNHAYLADM
jgi:hypothetical protein